MRGRTLINLQMFGVEGFTPDVCRKLTNWAAAITNLAQKLDKNKNVPRGSAKDWNNFK